MSFQLTFNKTFQKILASIESDIERFIELFLDDMADLILHQAENNLKGDGDDIGGNNSFGGATAFGELWRSGLVRKTSDDTREIGFEAPHAPHVEFGTKPFRPPIKPLLEWVKFRRITLGDTKDPLAVAVIIQNVIATRGLPQRPFFRQAIDKSLTRASDVAKQTASRIE